MKLAFAGFGPGALVTAAFIGPGTVTVCTLAGVNYGYSLLWVMLLSIAICYLLQEMTARLGIVTGHGLAEVIRSQITNPGLRALMIVMVFSAIVIGNGAYEAGNISGAALGLQELTGAGRIELAGLNINPVNLAIAALSFILLFHGNYSLLERVLISLVVLMSIAFILVAIVTRPPLAGLLQGLIPRMSAGQTLTVIGLVGTTVVPYNLFLHAHLAGRKWSGTESLAAMRRDAAMAIAIGGIISMAIIICAATVQGSTVSNAAQLGQALEPVFGAFSRYILAFGMFAAGITSAITAPLAAAFVVSGCLGWEQNLKSRNNRLVWAGVLLAGLLFSVFGGSPIEIIRFAQVTNGMLLPIIAAFVLWAVNRKQLLGSYTNGPLQNALGGVVMLAVSLLAARSLWLVLQN